jgi:hypothetical protein
MSHRARMYLQCIVHTCTQRRGKPVVLVAVLPSDGDRPARQRVHLISYSIGARMYGWLQILVIIVRTRTVRVILVGAERVHPTSTDASRKTTRHTVLFVYSRGITTAKGEEKVHRRARRVLKPPPRKRRRKTPIWNEIARGCIGP